MPVRRGKPFPTKAVIFTHFGGLTYEKLQKNEAALQKEYAAVLKRYIDCNKRTGQIGLVYIYVDWAVKKEIPASKPGNRETFSLLSDDAPAKEMELKGLLDNAESEARRKAGVGASDPPFFEYVGILELLGLLNNLVQVDASLTQMLCGDHGEFTYDSPKFVEAVIRMARGHTAHLARHPIVRFDEDVQPHAPSLRVLLAEYERMIRTKPFYFFSGRYGTKGKSDPVNDYAVRVHWFDNPQQIRCFLADLNELGAAQLEDSEHSYSTACQHLVAHRRERDRPRRKSPQVISGAGLIMSAKAVTLLPPFMNFAHLTTWVDDHLKRRLHEALADLDKFDPESVTPTSFKQDRHPGGITQKDKDWARDVYSERLIRGCIFTRLITDPNGRPTAYSTLISDIVTYRSLTVPANLRAKMQRWALERHAEVITCWQSKEFAHTALYDWAGSQTPKSAAVTCRQVVSDALDYLELLRVWPIFVRAVERLKFLGNDWLFNDRGLAP